MSFATLMQFASQNPMLSAIFAILTVALIYTEIMRFFVGYKVVSPAQLTDLINKQSALLIDVSPQNDFEKGHILGSKHVLMSQFDPENKLLAKTKDMPVAMVCRNGQQSAIAAKRLHKAGFTQVFWLNDGINAWLQADLPLSKGR
mgnify:FL=1